MTQIEALTPFILFAGAALGVILFCWAHSAAEQVETTYTGESRGSERA